VTIRRAIPEIATDDVAAARAFYEGVLGFEPQMEVGDFVSWSSPVNPEIQVMANATPGDVAPLPPGFSVDVGTGEAASRIYETCAQAGYEVLEELTDKPWGIRRFSVLDPSGTRVTILAHVEPR
jgi:uncharacterized glyoxalase superfamily protein PhnB